MPYCVHCGNQVAGRDRFCARCGKRQPNVPNESAGSAQGAWSQGTDGSGPPPPPPRPDVWGGVSDRTATLLCYIPLIGWIPAVALLASNRFTHDQRVRFHAFQGLYLFIAYLLVDWVVQPFASFPGSFLPRVIPSLLRLAVFVGWIFMIVKVSKDEDYRLPIVGELADRSVAEQQI